MTSPNIPVYDHQRKAPTMTPGQKRLQRHLLSDLYNEPAMDDDTPHQRSLQWVEIVGQR